MKNYEWFGPLLLDSDDQDMLIKICRPRCADQDMLTEYIGLALLFPCVPSSS